MRLVVIIFALNTTVLAMSPARKRLSWELACASQEGKVETVSNLLSKNPPLLMLIQGTTALHRASYKGYLPIVKLLLASGASLALTDRRGRTALHCAIKKKQLAVMKLLISYGADINATDKKGNTPLHKAVRGHFMQGVELLLEEGAQTNVINNRGQTLLHCAAASGCPKILRLVAQHLTSFDARTNRLETALHRAASRYKKAACYGLLKLICLDYMARKVAPVRNRLHTALMILRKLVGKDMSTLIISSDEELVGELFLCSIKEEVPKAVVLNNRVIPVDQKTAARALCAFLNARLTAVCSVRNKYKKQPYEVTSSSSLKNLLDPTQVGQHVIAIMSYSFGE